MDVREVLIITPCVGVDLCAGVGKREKEREGSNVPAPPPTAWICHKRKKPRGSEEGGMY